MQYPNRVLCLSCVTLYGTEKSPLLCGKFAPGIDLDLYIIDVFVCHLFHALKNFADLRLMVDF